MMSGQMRYLLDKVTARHMLEGLLKLAESRELTEVELYALDLFERAPQTNLRLFIVPPTGHILRQLRNLPHYTALIDFFLSRVELASPARYFKRWARRLQEYGFTPEDATVLALATFCTGQAGDSLGVHAVVTFDQPMMHHWALQLSASQAHFPAMQKDLPEPYQHAILPQVLRPAQMSP